MESHGACVPSDVASAPRGSTECRSNAARSRQQSDWFAHDHGPQPAAAVAARSTGEVSRAAASSAGQSSNRLEPPSNSSATGRPTSPRPAAGLSSAEDRCATPNSKRTFNKQHQFSNEDSQNWYKYGSDHKDVVIGRPSKSRNARGTNSDGDEVKKKMTACDSNDWFRHEHLHGEAISPRIDTAGRTPGKKPPKSPLARETVNSPLWAGHEVVEESHADARATPRPEAAEYLKRNKAGTSSDWFPHEHSADASNGISAASSRHKGTKESEENALRFKGDRSQMWFSHDPEQHYTEPRPHPKLTSPEARLLMERAKGDEMKQVFRMDQNLRTTWTAPTSTSATAQPAAPPAAENNQALIDKFLKSQDAHVSNGVNGSHADVEKTAVSVVE